MWVREPRVYIAAPDSLGLLRGTRLTFSYRGKKIAESEVTTVLDGELIAASLTSGSLRGVKKLERLAIAADRSAIRARSLLRVGYPARGRRSLLWTCRELKLADPPLHGAYRADVVDERSYRLMRDTAAAVSGPWPDTLLIRLFDDAADEEIALERGDLDVAVFWPGEASPHIREFARWQGRPVGMRGWMVATATGQAAGKEPVALGGNELRDIAPLNQEMFRGDLGPCSVTDPGEVILGGLTATRFEVDSFLPGRQALEQYLNRGRQFRTADAPRSVRISYLRSPPDSSDSLTMKCLFTVGCPVITTPDLRPYVETLGADALANLFDCGPAGKRP